MKKRKNGECIITRVCAWLACLLAAAAGAATAA